MRVFASSTMSWKCRSSSVTVGRAMGSLAWNAIEWEYERASIVCGFDFVVDVDEETLSVLRVGRGDHVDQPDARLPHEQSLFDVIGREAGGRRVVRREHEIVNLTTELRAHHALALRREQDHRDGLLDVSLAPRQRDATARPVDRDGERPPCTEKVVSYVRHAHITVPTATTVPTGKSTGSLHVSAVSPFRASGL